MAVAVTVNSLPWRSTAAPFGGLSMRTDGGASSTVTGTFTRAVLSSASDGVDLELDRAWPHRRPSVKVNGAEASV